LVEGPLEEFADKLKAATNAEPEGKRKTEVLWPILRLHHQRSRYIFDLFFKRKVITRELYDFLLREKFVDG
jgi:bud site selection protein 31